MLGLPLSTLNGALVSQTHKAKPVIMPAVKERQLRVYWQTAVFWNESLIFTFFKVYTWCLTLSFRNTCFVWISLLKHFFIVFCFLYEMQKGTLETTMLLYCVTSAGNKCWHNINFASLKRQRANSNVSLRQLAMWLHPQLNQLSLKILWEAGGRWHEELLTKLSFCLTTSRDILDIHASKDLW